VASGTQGDEILRSIVAQQSARLNMVDLEFAQAPTALAAPSIPLQYLLMKSSVGTRVEPKPRPLGEELVHEAFLTSSTNCCL
jgi:hypothetical protein